MNGTLKKQPKKRYSLAELIRDATKKDIQKLIKQNKWFQTGKSKGREIG